MLPNGSRYTGTCINNVPHGFGIIDFAKNYQIYRDLVAEKPKLKDATLTKYVGSIHYGEMDGKGKLYWSNDNIMIGEFVGNFFHGKGKLVSKTGKNPYIHIGQFSKGFEHGQGTRRYASGLIGKGNFNRGMGFGAYLIVYEDG